VNQLSDGMPRQIPAGLEDRHTRECAEQSQFGSSFDRRRMSVREVGRGVRLQPDLPGSAGVGPPKGGPHVKPDAALCHQDAVEHPLELAGALGQFAVARVCHVAAAKQLIGDVERGQDRHPQGIVGGRRVASGAELLVDVGGKPRDVLRVQGAADRVPLPVDLDGDETGLRLGVGADDVLP